LNEAQSSNKSKHRNEDCPSESGSVLQYTAYNYTEHSSNGSGFMDLSTSSQTKYVDRINGRNPRYK